MPKITFLHLFYFIGLILLGLLIGNIGFILVFQMVKQYSISEVLTGDDLMNMLTSRQVLIMQMSSQVLSLVIPSFVFLKYWPDSIPKINSKSFDPVLLLVALLLFLFFMPIVGWSAYLNQNIPLADWMIASEEKMIHLMVKLLEFNSLADLVIGIVVIALIPALAEELVFRGIIQNLLGKILNRADISIILTALVFSIIHMQFAGFLPRFLLGLILGFIYFRAGNLWIVIILHFINNAVQVLTLHYMESDVLTELTKTQDPPDLYLSLTSCFLFALLTLYFNKQTKDTIHV